MNNDKCIECKSILYGNDICSICGRDNSKIIMPKLKTELKKELKWRKLKENKLTRPFLNGTPSYKKNLKKFNLNNFIKFFSIIFIINAIIYILLKYPVWYNPIISLPTITLFILIGIKRGRKK